MIEFIFCFVAGYLAGGFTASFLGLAKPVVQPKRKQRKPRKPRAAKPSSVVQGDLLADREGVQ